MNIQGSGEAKIALESIKRILRGPNSKEAGFATKTLDNSNIAVIVRRRAADLVVLEGLQEVGIGNHVPLFIRL
jgi:hypothetical protein